MIDFTSQLIVMVLNVFEVTIQVRDFSAPIINLSLYLLNLFKNLNAFLLLFSNAFLNRLKLILKEVDCLILLSESILVVSL